MIVVMDPHSSTQQVSDIVKLLRGMGVESCVIQGAERPVVEAFGTNGGVDRSRLEQAPGVSRVLDQAGPELAAGRKPGEETSEVPLGLGAVIGGRRVAVIAGPCSVESRNQLIDTAVALKESGAIGLRGGAFKPRTSPYSFQGHGESGLEMLAEARERTGLAIVTEVIRCEHVELVAKYADVLQVGSRNMHNSHLLGAVGSQPKPVLLKRGWSATLEEFLLAAEYIMAHGNQHVVLCERGIRTHERYVRNTLALAVVPEIKRLSRLPIVVDPSHGTGRRHLVTAMSRAAIACGADGLLIEAHPDPDKAWTDGDQSIDLEQFRLLVESVAPIAEACDRTL